MNFITLAGLRTFVGVSIVAALIWIFAEAESQRKVEVQAECVFSAEVESGRIIDVIDAAETGSNRVRAVVSVSGSSASIDAAEQIFRRPIVFTPGMSGVPRESGEGDVNLRDAIRAHPDIRDRGVTILAVEPASVRVFVDEMATVTVKVAASITPELVEGAPEVKPPTVSIVLPKSEALLLTEASVAIAKIAPGSLASLTPGRRQTLASVGVQLPSEIINSNHARIEPPAVEVSLTLRAQTRSVKLATVPVHLRVAPGEFGKWDIEIPQQDRFLSDVTITGPSEAVKQIEDKVIPVIATLPLSFEELERMISSKEAVFTDLPPGVRAEVTNRTIRLKIEKRAQPIDKED